MNTETARTLITQLRSVADQLDTEFPAPPRTPVYDTAEALDKALSLALPGETLLVSPTLVYTAPLILRQRVTLRSTSVIDGRMPLDLPAPRFLNGAQFPTDGVTVTGLDIRHTNPLTDIATIAGGDVIIDRCRILGDPEKGAKRGIAANGRGNVTIRSCYIDDCFQAYPGSDSQAICSWDMLPGLAIENCYLSGGSETIMLGGSDSRDEAHMPANVAIVANVITKNPQWQAKAIGVKNTIELKSCKKVLINDNDISESWGGHGQDGYLLALTVRNQDGRAPWSTIQDVMIEGNRLAHAAAALNLLGLETIKETKTDRPTPVGAIRPSVRMARVSFIGNKVTDIDPTLFAGSKRMILINGGPNDLTIDDNSFEGKNLSSVVYFVSGRSENLNIRNNSWPHTTYGIFGNNTAAALVWQTFVASGEKSGNVEV